MKVSYTSHDHEHELEPEFGMPEPLPEGERVLWQGAPDFLVMARRVFHVRKLIVYFALILGIRAAVVLSEGGSLAAAGKALALMAPLAALAVLTALGLAALAARTTAYTITDKRVVMRIGIVLNLTFNLPFARIATAGLRLHRDGTGDIPLTLAGTDQIAFIHLWPHARPWRVARPEPMLRCVADADRVARILGAAWTAAVGTDARPIEATGTAAPARAGSGDEEARGDWFNRPRDHRMTQGA